jgi:uroporphyrinogen-III synthase
VQALDLYQHVIAISPGAARAFIAYAEEWWPQWPVGIHWYGVGSATGAALSRAGLPVRVPDDGHTSEHLLALRDLSTPNGERVLLLKGEGGRQLLADTLAARGALIETMTLYRRVCPDYEPTVITRALREFDPHAIVVLSIETLNNLIRLGKNRDHHLTQRMLLVPAERVAEAARDAGFGQVRVAQSLTPDGLAQCLPVRMQPRI